MKILFWIVCPYSAYELRPSICCRYKCIAYLLTRQSKRNGNIFKMHSDKRASDIQAGMSLDMLDHDRITHSVIHSCCKRASGLGHGSYTNLFKHIFLGSGTLNDKRSVEMLAALCCKIYSVFIKYLEYSLGNDHAGLR